MSHIPPKPMNGKQVLARGNYWQLFWKPPYPQTDFSNRVVIVTGGNVGLGKWAAYHFARLGAAKVIVSSRSAKRGEDAMAEIEAELPPSRRGVVEVWPLDLCSYDSVREFAKRAATELPRLDHVVLNASVAMSTFNTSEENEQTLTVNVVSTFMLAMLLLPKLRATAAAFNAAMDPSSTKATTPMPNPAVPPSLTIVGSAVQVAATLPQRDAPSIFDAMNNPETAAMGERYPASKLLQLLALREMAKRMPMNSAGAVNGSATRHPRVILNMVNPGLNKTELARSVSGFRALYMTIYKALYAWEAEEGSRTLVHGTIAGPESHGVILSECNVWNDALGDFVPSEEGKKTQEKFWAELVQKLEKIEPGITKVLE